MLKPHHDHPRSLMRTLERPELPGGRRREVLDELAAELSLHEQVADEIFYPAMHDISTLVTVSHAEQRELDDQVAVVARVSGDGARFAEEFRALVAGFEHHPRLDERRMFPEVEAKVDHGLLTDMGDRLSARLERLRSSPVTRIRMRITCALLRRL